ncbi:hypothetical protein PFLUV_G00156920 [Perca fluviatilis]|uniref:Uncharacterized protein n=1 Tax=Perca fluviatilis TaxID=8168 RepID=A0A6A5ETI1_PERFL|nr:hypothetical protein PFLUV_G00156920 [Perca fluviatilis]
MAVTSVMSSRKDQPTFVTLRSDWTRGSHVSFLLDFRRVNHGLMSMTSIVYWTLRPLERVSTGSFSAFYQQYFRERTAALLTTAAAGKFVPFVLVVQTMN